MTNIKISVGLISILTITNSISFYLILKSDRNDTFKHRVIKP